MVILHLEHFIMFYDTFQKPVACIYIFIFMERCVAQLCEICSTCYMMSVVLFTGLTYICASTKDVLLFGTLVYWKKCIV